MAPSALTERAGAAALQFARAAAADADALSALAGVVWRAHYPSIIAMAQIDYMLAQRYAPALIRDEIARGVIWDTARAGGRPVGFSACLPPRAGEMKLDKLYVHPDFQRRGCGRQLVARAAAAARAAGCAALVLAVNKRNAPALAAYRGYGFRVREAMVQQIGGGFVMDDYLMVMNV